MNQDYNFIPLSALQHILFCERQCALIHIEQQWMENYLTAHGRQLHEKVDSEAREKRKTKIIEFSVPLCSYELEIQGKADAIEFHLDDQGRILTLLPVEHKRGKAKESNWDRVQLCAQGLCLEEMLDIPVNEGCLFYHATKRREMVPFSESLRKETVATIHKVHRLFRMGVTPPANYKKRCDSCSFLDICKPKTLGRSKSVVRFLGQTLSEKVSEKHHEKT